MIIIRPTVGSNNSDSSVFSVSSSQAQDHNRITRTQGSMNPKNAKDNAPTGTTRRTLSTKAPMNTRAGTAKTLSTSAPGHFELAANTGLTNVSQINVFQHTGKQCEPHFFRIRFSSSTHFFPAGAGPKKEQGMRIL